jgi:hypothetical protein
MSDFIQPIGPVERDVEAVYRVERAQDEGEKRDREQPKKRPPREAQTQTQTQEDAGPVEGDDGHLHIDIRA